MPEIPSYLLHVGYPKSASSWIQQALFATMPEIDVVSSEPGIRRALIDLQTPGVPFAEDDFASALHARHAEVGKPMLLTRESLIRTPLDANLAKTEANARRLARLCVGARVLIVVRRQQDLIPSLYSQYVHEGGTMSFAAVMNGKDPSYQMDLDMLDMADTIGVFERHFGADHVVVVPFELLRSDPASFLDHVERFLDTTLARENLDMAPVNPSTIPALLPALRMWNRLFRKSRFNPKPLVRWMRGHHRGRQILQGPASRLARRVGIRGTLVLDDDRLEQLRPRLGMMNAELQQYVAADLKALGYIV